MPQLAMSVERGVLVVRVSGALDLLTAQDVHDRLLDLADCPGSHIIVNLENLKTIDSAGLASFLAANRRARRLGGRIVFVIGDSHAMRLFEVTGLSQFFELYATHQAALDSFDPRSDGAAAARVMGTRLKSWLISQPVLPTPQEVLHHYQSLYSEHEAEGVAYNSNA